MLASIGRVRYSWGGLVPILGAVLLAAVVGILVPQLGASVYVWAVVAAPLIIASLLLIIMRPELGIVLIALLCYNPVFSSLRLNMVIWSYVPVFVVLGVTTISILTKTRTRSTSGVVKQTYSIMILFMLYLSFSAVYGWISGNVLIYVVSDFVQMMELPLVYWLTLQVLSYTDRPQPIVFSLLGIFGVTATWNLAVTLRPGTVLFAASQASAATAARIGEETVTRLLGDVPVLFLPILAAVFILAGKQLAAKRRLVLGFLVLIAAANVLLSFTRSAWGGQAVAFLCLVVFAAYVGRSKDITRWIAITGAFLLLVLLFSVVWNSMSIPLINLIFDRLRFTVNQVLNGNASLDVRLYEYSVANFTLMNSPVWGWGLGWQYTGFLTSEGLGLKHWMHNVYIALWSRMGLLGLGVTASYIGMMLSVLIRRMRSVSSITDQAIVSGVLASLIGFAAQSFLWGTFFSHPNPIFIGLGLGLAVHLADRRLAIEMIDNQQASFGSDTHSTLRVMRAVERIRVERVE